MMFKKQKFHQLSLFRDKSVKGPLGRVGGYQNVDEGGGGVKNCQNGGDVVICGMDRL